MNWTKIKSLMIFFLIGINVFLLVFLSVTTYRRNIVPDEVLSASVKVLEKEGFMCEKNILPSSYVTLPSLAAEFHTASSLSSLFFGRQLAFRTADNSLVATDGKATLTINGNYFLFESGYDADPSFSPKKIKRELKNLGLDMSGAVYDEKTGYFYYMYKNINLFNMYIEARLDQDGELCYVSAQWPAKLSVLDKKTFSFSESIMNLKTVFPGGGKIKNIEAGYSLHAANSSEKYLFSPAWRVTVGEESKILK